MSPKDFLSSGTFAIKLKEVFTLIRSNGTKKIEKKAEVKYENILSLRKIIF